MRTHTDLSAMLDVGGRRVEVVRKEIKNLHLAVYPPAGRIRVSVPRRVSDEEVRLAVISRLGWIKRRQRDFAEQERQSAREMVSGESHWVAGRRYRLELREDGARPSVELSGSMLRLRVPRNTDTAERQRILDEWYRRRLRTELDELIRRWEPVLSVKVRHIGIRKMRTKWGSCNRVARRIWLNLELAKKLPACLEYVLVHELVHFHERLHNQRFVDYMDRVVPEWRTRKSELNQAPLSHVEWDY